MAFGQQSGPPASTKQIQFLLSLVHQAGHLDFRDARGPLGLTQRQAGGKFSVGEAAELIDRLQSGDTEPGDVPAISPAAEARAAKADAKLETERAMVLRGMPANLLAAELERRDWVVIPPV
jgi:hypothetical protein